MSPKEMGEAILRNLKDKTGKSIEEWFAEINTKDLPKSKKELSKILKENYGLGHFQARKITEEFLGIHEYADEKTLIQNQFTKEQLDIFETIQSYILGLGKDVKMKPCKTYVPFSRKTQFVAISSSKKGVLIAIYINSSSCKGYENKSFSGSPKLNFRCELNSKDEFNDVIKDGLTLAYMQNE